MTSGTGEAHKIVTVSLPRSLIERLDEASRARDVGRRWLIERLLADGVDRLIPVEDLRLTRDQRAVPMEAGERPRTAAEVAIPMEPPSEVCALHEATGCPECFGVDGHTHPVDCKPRYIGT